MLACTCRGWRVRRNGHEFAGLVQATGKIFGLFIECISLHVGQKWCKYQASCSTDSVPSTGTLWIFCEAMIWIKENGTAVSMAVTKKTESRNRWYDVDGERPTTVEEAKKKKKKEKVSLLWKMAPQQIRSRTAEPSRWFSGKKHLPPGLPTWLWSPEFTW